MSSRPVGRVEFFDPSNVLVRGEVYERIKELIEELEEIHESFHEAEDL